MATNFDLNSDKTTIIVEQFFKTVSAKSNPNSPRVGQKREDVRMEFPVISPESLTPEQIQTLAHELVANYAKKLIAQNSENWDYIPTEENCNFHLAYEDLIADSNRGFRKLSAEILKELCSLYGSFATEIGKSQKAVENGIKIISSRLKMLSGLDNQIVIIFAEQLAQFREWLEEKNYPAPIIIGSDELIRIISEMLESEVAIDLDSI